MIYFLYVFECFEELGDDCWWMDIWLEIGFIYQDMGEYRQAWKYFDVFYQFYVWQGVVEAFNIIFVFNQFVVLYEQMQKVDFMLYYVRVIFKVVE